MDIVRLDNIPFRGLLLGLIGLALFAAVATAKTETGPQTRPQVTRITTDKAIADKVQALWRGGFEPCTEEGIDTSQSLNGWKIVFHGDAPGSALYILACGGPGYNRPYVAIAVNGKTGNLQRVPFPVVLSDGVSSQYVIYNPVWDNSKQQLSAFGKDRGLADCGRKAIWQWVGHAGQGEFVLISQKDKFDCDGRDDNFLQSWPPANWPPDHLKE